jgi:class 3 adenylate cyclase
VVTRADVARLIHRTARTVAVGNLLGAVVTFHYFTFIDVSGRRGSDVNFVASILYFALSFAVAVVVAQITSWRSTGPLRAWARDGGAPDLVVRQRAIALPFVMARVSAIGWLLAGIAWAVVWPAIIGEREPVAALRRFIGITLVGGTVTTLFLFFAIERAWRPTLPVFFPDGDVSATPGAVRVPVRARLLAVFLLVGIVPLVLMGVLSYTRATLLAAAPPAVASSLLRDMAIFIAFVIAVGGATAVGFAFFVSRSVAAPLADLEAAMADVARGDLAVRAPVVSHDEIGAVAEGFNRMVDGLRERERIRDAFGRYVSPEVRDEILRAGSTRGGFIREVTILFSDLRDFTPWVESHAPDEVVRDLNTYFTLMEGAIRAHGGLVLQFIGDEIEAVFGAPVPAPDHADHAVAAGLEMRRRLGAWNDTRRAAGSVEIRHGIGIHTGDVLAASIGSPDRLSYALVGDPVNLASRIQDLTKDVGAEVLVSGATMRRLKTPVALEALPAVRVKGRTAEVEVYRAA